METLGHQLRARRRSLGISQKALAARVGCVKSYVSQLESGRRAAPSAEMVSRFEDALGLERGVLRGGAAGARLAALLRERGLDAMHRAGELRLLVDGGGAERVIAPLERALEPVPLINKVAAGTAREFTDLGYPAGVADDYAPAPATGDPDAFAARVVGDSMRPEYVEGDIVVFSPLRDVSPGDDCFVRFEDGAESTFKRVYFETGEDGEELIRLVALNPCYPERVASREAVAGLFAAVYMVRGVGAERQQARASMP